MTYCAKVPWDSVSQRFRPATGCCLCEAGRLASLLPPRSRQLSPPAWHWPGDGDVAAARVLSAPSILQVPARLLVEEPGGAACKAPQVRFPSAERP